MIVVPPAELREFVRALLVATGMEDREAQVAAEVTVWSDLVGRSTQGVWRLPVLVERLARGLVRSPCRLHVERVSASIRRVDGGDGFGYFVGHEAMEQALDAARETGVGIVGVSRSNHLGAGAFYVQLAASRGHIGLATSNASPKVAPFGGIEPVLGTNPIALGCPRRNGRSILVDFATAASAGSSIRKAQHAGGTVPEGLLIDRSGQPVSEPGRAPDAVLLPDGVKGYGLALLVEVLAGVLTGAGVSHGVGSMYADWSRPSNVGHFFLALDIARFLPLESYYERLESLLCIVEQSRPQEGVERVLVPGEGRWRKADEQAHGIRLEPGTAAQLEELARRLEVRAPWTAVRE